MSRVPPRVPRPTPVEAGRSPRLAALARLVAAAGPAVLEDFWQTVTVPLVERDPDPDHRLVTFLHRSVSGESAHVVINKITDPADPSSGLLRELPGTDVRFLTLRMRADWRASYRINGGPDPLCTSSVTARGVVSSLVELPCAPAGLTTADDVALHEHQLSESRRVWVYEPPADGPRDLLIVLDGEVWAKDLPLAPVLDRLIASGAIPPVVAVFIDSVDLDTRWRDLSGNEPFLGFLHEVATWAGEKYNATTDPARTVIAGQSLGGLTALWAASRSPERFGAALSQSASLWIEDVALDLSATRLHIEVGLQEWVLLPLHRELLGQLPQSASYAEYNGGHDFACWQVGLADGIIRLLGSN